MKRLCFGFLMDPLENVNVDHDTTFALMLAAQARGHELRVFEQPHLFFRVDQSYARMRTVRLRRERGAHFDVLKDAVAPIAELDVVFLRKDPPADLAFIHATQLIELTGTKRPLLVNRASSLRDANEKMFGLRLPDLFPHTLVSSDAAELREFVHSHPPRVVLKPIDGFAGQGIVSATAEDHDLMSLIELVTHRGRELVVAQAFIPEVTEGDLRIVLLDGDPIGSVLRVPAARELRANMAVGGSALAGSLTERELEICRRLKPLLLDYGLHFVGIDVIGGLLTEVNVTSPTGLVEAEKHSGEDLGSRVIAWAEQKVAS